MARVTLDIPLNRVEGDLDIRVTIEDGTIVDAQSIGTLYRGFENMLQGRDPMDALVITPRICGICSITHLTASVKAIEHASGIVPPPQAVRMRNLSILAETVQSDLRQFFLMFVADFAHQSYQNHTFFELAQRLYAPLKGSASIEALKASKEILKVVAIIGGQWPHTSHMVPGGICTIPTLIDMTLAENHIDTTTQWYEQAVLGDSLENFQQQVTSQEALYAWAKQHPDTHLAYFISMSQEAGLMAYGRSYGNFLSYGIVDDPESPSQSLIRSGTYSDEGWAALDLNLIAEDLSHSWFKQTPVVQPPSEGKTEPDPSVDAGYSWGKAPRYNGQPMQTGPIAQALVDGDALFIDLYQQQGDSVFVRELARLLRPVKHLAHLKQQVNEVLTHFDELSYIPPRQNFSGEGVGITEAARGALGHWLRIENGQIEHYQIITPTAWNASPKDQTGQPGAWEKALIGQTLKDPDNPMEMGHIIRSFDPCLVCTVHAVGDLSTPQTHYFGVN